MPTDTFLKTEMEPIPVEFHKVNVKDKNKIKKKDDNCLEDEFYSAPNTPIKNTARSPIKQKTANAITPGFKLTPLQPIPQNNKKNTKTIVFFIISVFILLAVIGAFIE